MIEYDQEPRNQKKRKKETTNTTWLVIGIVAGILLLVGVIVVIVVLVRRPGDDLLAQGNAPPGQQPGAQAQPAPRDGGRFQPIAAPQGVVQNVRAAAMRPERQNELRNIGQFFTIYFNDFNRNPKTEEEFAKYIERDAPKIAEAIREKHYVLNMKAKIGGPGVIAYEQLPDGGRHLAVRTDGSVDLIPPDELQTLLMQ